MERNSTLTFNSREQWNAFSSDGDRIYTRSTNCLFIWSAGRYFLKKTYRLLMGQLCLRAILFSFNWISINVVGNNEMCKHLKWVCFRLHTICWHLGYLAIMNVIKGYGWELVIEKNMSDPSFYCWSCSLFKDYILFLFMMIVWFC